MPNVSPDKLLEKAKPIAEKAKMFAEKARPFAAMGRPFVEKARPLAGKAKPYAEKPIAWVIAGALVAGGIFAYSLLKAPSTETPVAEAPKSSVLPSCDSEKIVSTTSKIMREAVEKSGFTIAEFELLEFVELYGSVEDQYRFCEAQMRFNGDELELYVRVHWSDEEARDLKIVANTNKRAVITVPEH